MFKKGSPSSEDPLFSLENVILTPHMASLLRNLPIPNRLRRGADSVLAKLTCLYGLCSKCKVLG